MTGLEDVLVGQFVRVVADRAAVSTPGYPWRPYTPAPVIAVGFLELSSSGVLLVGDERRRYAIERDAVRRITLAGFPDWHDAPTADELRELLDADS